MLPLQDKPTDEQASMQASNQQLFKSLIEWFTNLGKVKKGCLLLLAIPFLPIVAQVLFVVLLPLLGFIPILFIVALVVMLIFLRDKVGVLLVGEDKYRQQKRGSNEAFSEVYDLLVSHYLDDEKKPDYTTNLETNPLVFDFNSEQLNYESSTLFFFKKRRQLLFAELKSIKFIIDNKKETCVINGGKKTNISFRFRKTDYEKYTPVLSALWADIITFEDNTKVATESNQTPSENIDHYDF